MRAAIGRGTHTLSLKLITTSLFVLFAADTGFSWQINHGAYHAFNWLDVPYQACVLLVGLAADLPTVHEGQHVLEALGRRLAFGVEDLWLISDVHHR